MDSNISEDPILGWEWEQRLGYAVYFLSSHKDAYIFWKKGKKPDWLKHLTFLFNSENEFRSFEDLWFNNISKNQVILSLNFNSFIKFPHDALI